MKRLLLLLVLFGNQIQAQNWYEHIVSSSLEDPRMSIPFDINDDGYIDVLSSEAGVYNLVWFRNLDGQGNFGPQNLISDNPALYLSIDFVDLDTDGDKDLLYLENNPRIVGWFENLNGLGNFSEEQIIEESQSDFIRSVTAFDIDDDGDLDLVSTISDTFEDRMVWYENIDGAANFSSEILIVDEVYDVHPPLFVDINNDGLNDILTSSDLDYWAPAKLIWYPNLGNATFGDEHIIYLFPFNLSDWTSIYYIASVDINTDDKLDIAIISHNDDLGTFYHWFENINNQGVYGPIQSLPRFGIFCDIDNDGDNDILHRSSSTNRIYWVENSDGLGSFINEWNIKTGLEYISGLDYSDFNDDGLLDVVSASGGTDEVVWYENTGIFGISDHILNQLIVYPNPAHDFLTIINTSAIVISSIHIYDDLGRLVISDDGKDNQIDVSHLNSGILFVEIETDQGVVIKKVIKE